MLVLSESEADFSKECAGGAISHSIPKTHPPPIRESSTASASRIKDERGRR